MKVTLADWKATKRHKDLVNRVLDSARLTYGPMHREFEEKFAQLHDRKHAIFTNSGTSALQVSLHYLKDKHGWKDGDEVLVPAVTFVATVNAVLQNNLKPVLVDVDLQYFDIDVAQAKVTKRTKAIIPVHLLGQPCDMNSVMKFARKNKLKVIEDSCETMFVYENGYPVGSRGDIACFSSYLAHVISTGVGGFILTNNKKDHDAMRSMIWHGRDNAYLNIDDNEKEKKKLIHKRFKFNRIGYSYRATELEAALGIAELEMAGDIISGRQMNAGYLYEHLEDLEDYITLPRVREGHQHAWMFFPILVNSEKDRDKLALYLEEHGIQTRWMMPLTNQPVYKDWINEDDYPNAKYLNNHAILVGCHQYLTIEELDHLINTIREYFND